MSLSIVENGETVLSKGYGMQDIENSIPASSDNLFSIGSISKSFVATLVVKILSEKYPEEGESVLDKPIRSFGPLVNFTLSDRFRSEQTTFRDILSHRTGLISTDFDFLFGTVTTRQEYNYRTRYQKQICGHRAKHVYNNPIYAYAGKLISSIARKPLEQLLKEFMLEIGMQSSTVIDHSGSYEKLPTMSKSYYQKAGATHEFNRTLLRRISIGVGTAGILSTSNDMAKYMEFHINKGKVGGKQIVAEDAMGWLKKSSIATGELPNKSNVSGPTGAYAYGLGLTIALYDGYGTYGHEGYWAPYHSYFRIYQVCNKSIGVFLTTNGPGFFLLLTPDVVNDAIFDVVLSGTHNLKKPAPPSTTIGITNTNKATKSTVASRLHVDFKFEEVVGLYGNDSGGNLIIRLDPENSAFLQIKYGEWGIGRLLAQNDSNTKYLIDWKTDIRHVWYSISTLFDATPTFHIDFNLSEKGLNLLSNNVPVFFFARNATLESFPVIPWDPCSCGPK